MATSSNRRLKLISTPNVKSSYYALWYKDYLDGMGYAPDSDIAGNITVNFPTWLKEVHIDELVNLARKYQAVPTDDQVTFLCSLFYEFQKSKSLR